MIINFGSIFRFSGGKALVCGAGHINQDGAVAEPDADARQRAHRVHPNQPRNAAGAVRGAAASLHLPGAGRGLRRAVRTHARHHRAAAQQQGQPQGLHLQSTHLVGT